MSFGQRVIGQIKKIPRGKVATYGQIAALAGSPRAAIVVGSILHHQSERYDLPWQRVISSRGIISTTCLEHPPQLQASLLSSEGVTVKEADQTFLVDLSFYGWRPGKD
jgi:methylated-DNA-protein-cysteine methyltransferase related protein